MRILVTGARGFIGGRIATHLYQYGHAIVLGSRRRSAPYDWLPGVEVVQTNWNDELDLASACKGIDLIIHTAGMNSQDCISDPVAALSFNGLGTARLVAAASRVGVERFVYLSTAHVYASQLVGVINEFTCTRNLHPYATSHLSGEHAVLFASEKKQIRGLVLRLSNTFGVPMHVDVNCWQLLLNDLCKQAVQTRKLILRSGGKEQRDFISMDEVCRVIEYLSVMCFDDYESNVVNVGSGNSKTVIEMAKLVQQRCQLVLGYMPRIEVNELLETEKLTPLEYNSFCLPKLNSQINNEITKAEIDRLLNYCKEVFCEK